MSLQTTSHSSQSQDTHYYQLDSSTSKTDEHLLSAPSSVSSNQTSQDVTIIPHLFKISRSTYNDLWNWILVPFLSGIAFGIGTHLSRGLYIECCNVFGIKGSLTLPISTPNASHSETRIIHGNRIQIQPPEPLSAGEIVKDAAATAVGAAVTQ